MLRQGGTLEAAFTLIDVIDLLGVPVHATCIGRAEGAALGVLAVATRRLAIPHARLRLCEPTNAFAGRADDVASWAAQLSWFENCRGRNAPASPAA